MREKMTQPEIFSGSHKEGGREAHGLLAMRGTPPDRRQ